MKITVKLYALLDKYLPAGTSGNEAVVEAEEGATPLALMKRLNLPSEHCHLVLVNGVYVAPSERGTTVLHDGDALAMWPPVAGG